MKLLKKDEIDKLKNQDKAREFEEGLKLSKRVDSLRELMADEEAKLAKFRSETISAIMKDIDEFEKVKSELSTEIDKLREEKNEGLKVILKRKRELDAFEDSLNKRALEIDELDKKSKERELKSIHNLEESKKELERARTQTEETSRKHALAEGNKTEMEYHLNQAKKIEDTALEIQEKIDKELELKVNSIKERENECVSREEEIKEEKEQIKLEWIKIKDQRETLERAINRINKNG